MKFGRSIFMKGLKRQETYKKPKAVKLETIQGIQASFSTYEFKNNDLNELVNPNLGLITGFNDLMYQLESLRLIDLGQTPPALGVFET